MLLDQGIEMTDPSVSRKLSRRKRNHDSSRRSSADSPNLIKPNGTLSQQKAISSKATVIPSSSSTMPSSIFGAMLQ